MLVGVQQYLNSLPSYKARRQQSRYRRRLKRVGRRVQAMEAAQRLINERQGRWIGSQKQGIIISPYFPIEGRQPFRREISCPGTVVECTLESKTQSSLVSDQGAYYQLRDPQTEMFQQRSRALIGVDQRTPVIRTRILVGHCRTPHHELRKERTFA